MEDVGNVSRWVTPDMLISTITLEKLRVGASYVLDRAVMEEPELLGWAMEQAMLSLRSHVLANKLVEREDIFERPTSAWQMWKERHAPYWFVRRWPVQMEKRVVTFKRYVTFPDAMLRFPKELGHPRILELRDVRYEVPR